MSSKPGFASQLLFAFGVLIVVIAIVAYLMGEFSPPRTAATIMVGLVIAIGAWRKMRR